MRERVNRRGEKAVNKTNNVKVTTNRVRKPAKFTKAANIRDRTRNTKDDRSNTMLKVREGRT